MKLYLLRHGEAKSNWIDPLRPLTDNGKANVRRIAESVISRGENFDRILHSGKSRTEQTAKIFSETFEFNGFVGMADGLNPEDNVLEWVQRIGETHENLLIVGHLPFLDYFASVLVTGTMNKTIVGFLPSTFACLEMNEETQQWELLFVLHSEEYL